MTTELVTQENEITFNASQLIARSIPIRKRQAALVVAGCAAVALGGFFLGARDIDPRDVFRGWFCVVLFGGGGLFYLVNVFFGTRLKVGPDGIEINYNLFKSGAWRWSEMGRFVVDEQRLRGGVHRYACAYTDRHHDLLLHGGSDKQPRYSDADILIPLANFAPGRSRERSAEFIEELNAWRKQYGSPELQTGDGDAGAEMSEFLKKTKFRRLRYVAIVTAVIALLIVLTYFEVEIGRLIQNLG